MCGQCDLVLSGEITHISIDSSTWNSLCTLQNYGQFVLPFQMSLEFLYLTLEKGIDTLYFSKAIFESVHYCTLLYICVNKVIIIFIYLKSCVSVFFWVLNLKQKFPLISASWKSGWLVEMNVAVCQQSGCQHFHRSSTYVGQILQV